MTIDTNSVPTQRASVDAAELEGGVKIWLTIQGETSHTTMAWRAPSWDALAETIDTTPSNEVAALLSRVEAAERERDEALADIERIQKERAEFLAGVEALVGALKGERDEALAREAALHALILEGDDPAKMVDADYLRRLAIAAHSPQEAAVARDAALVERGRREGIEEAARECDEYAAWRGEFDDGLSGYSDQAVGAAECAEAIRALATPPAGDSPPVVRLPGEGGPQPGDLWVHHSGRVYRIDRITNTAHPSAKFPPAVVYVNVENGTEWSRALSDWHRSFKPAPPADGGQR
jgi:hypothetical protein